MRDKRTPEVCPLPETDAAGGAGHELWQRQRVWIESQIRARARFAPKGYPEDLFVESLRDSVQDKVLRAGGSCRDPLLERGFLKRLITNAAISEYRKWRRDARTLDRGADVAAVAVPDRGPDPERAAVAAERAVLLCGALRTLREARPKAHEAVVRCLVDGEGAADVAADHGVSPHTVWVWTGEGKERLRTLLKTPGNRSVRHSARRMRVDLSKRRCPLCDGPLCRGRCLSMAAEPERCRACFTSSITRKRGQIGCGACDGLGCRKGVRCSRCGGSGARPCCTCSGTGWAGGAWRRQSSLHGGWGFGSAGTFPPPPTPSTTRA